MVKGAGMSECDNCADTGIDYDLEWGNEIKCEKCNVGKEPRVIAAVIMTKQDIKVLKLRRALAKIGLAVLEDKHNCLRCTLWSDNTTTVVDEVFGALGMEHDGDEDNMIKILKGV